MTLMQWYVSRGRINRSTWWLQYTLPLMLLSVLATTADLAFGYVSWTDLMATDKTGPVSEPGLTGQPSPATPRRARHG